MKPWLKFVLVVNAIGGGFSGLVAFGPAALQQVSTLQDAAVMSVLLSINCFGLYSGWQLVQARDRMPVSSKVFLWLQAPFVSSAWLTYEYLGALGFRVSFSVVEGSKLALTTVAHFGTVTAMYFMKGFPFGVGVNLVAVLLIVLASRATQKSLGGEANAAAV